MHTSRNASSQDIYSVMTEAWSSEQDLIDSVWVAYRETEPVSLRLTPQGIWSARFSASYLHDPQLGGVVGQPFAFSVLSKEDSIYELSTAYLFRVIESTPVLIEPRAADTVSAFPELRWAPFTASFPFTYLVSVVKPDTGFEVMVWATEPLDADSNRVTVGDSLDNATYYWTLTVLDVFENSSRSKEGYFVVNQPGQP